MSIESEVIAVLRDVLMLGVQADEFSGETALLGALPEFDSLAIASVIAALEEEFDVMFDDDELTAEMFETVGSLSAVVNEK